MKISYECSDLIQELEQDILEFGFDQKFYAFFEQINGSTFLTDYDFINDALPLNFRDVGNATVVIMTAKEILDILKEQNKII